MELCHSILPQCVCSILWMLTKRIQVNVSWNVEYLDHCFFWEEVCRSCLIGIVHEQRHLNNPYLENPPVNFRCVQQQHTCKLIKIDSWNYARVILLATLIIQGGSNMTGTDLCANKPHCAAAVRPWESKATTSCSGQNLFSPVWELLEWWGNRRYRGAWNNALWSNSSLEKTSSPLKFTTDSNNSMGKSVSVGELREWSHNLHPPSCSG